MRTTLSLLVFLYSFLVRAQFGIPQLVYRDETGGSWHGLDCGDLDGDGDLDILYMSEKPAIAWLRNSGDGSFSRANIVEEDRDLNTSGGALLRILDMDADVDNDVLVAEREYGTGNLRIRVLTNDGVGHFTSDQLAFFDDPGSLHALVDLEQDGDIDIITRGMNSDGWGILWNQNNTGFSVQTVPIQIQYGVWGPVVDVNADGHLDLVGYYDGFQADSTIAWLSDGAGGWGATVRLMNGIVEHLFAADMDLDGFTDLIVDSANVMAVKYGLPGGAFESILLPIVPNTWDASLITIADLDGNGTQDVIYRRGTSGSAFEYRMNNGDRTFTFGGYVDEEGFFEDAADLTGDGQLDILRMDEMFRLHLHRDLSQDLYGTQLLNQLRTNSLLGPLVADETCDGFDDLLIDEFGLDLRFEGGVGFSSTPTLSDNVMSFSSERADLNGDGCVDRLRRNGNGLQVVYNDGSGVFSASQNVYSGNLLLQNLNFSDVDLDGDLDLLADNGSGSTQPMVFLPNDGSGQFGANIENIGSGPAESIFTHDFGSDGTVEVVTSGYGYVRVSRRQLDGSFTTIYSDPGGWPCALGNDLFFFNADGMVRTRYQLGQGGFFSSLLTIASEAEGVGLQKMDLNADGETDLYYADTLAKSVGFLLGPFSFGMQPDRVLLDVQELHSVDAIDLEADGLPELAVVADQSLFLVANVTNAPFRVEGTVFLDFEGLGVLPSEPIGVSGVLVGAEGAADQVFSTSDGNYILPLSEGEFNMNVELLGPWMIGEPLVVELSEGTPVLTGQHIGLVPTELLSQPRLSMVEGPTRCNEEGLLWCTLRNAGTVRDTVILTLELDPLYTYISSTPVPTSISGTTLSWQVNDLLPFEQRNFQVVVRSPDFTQLGNPVENTLTAQSQVLLAPAGSDAVSWQGIVTCAYDPNDKQVHPVGFGDAHAVPIDTDVLTYTIRFQNTGNDVALDVRLADILDEWIDPLSVEVIATSHPLSGMIVDGRMITFEFLNILLPDSGADLLGSQGFLRFHCRVDQSVAHLSSVENTADIYFDQNPAITTNIVYNTFVDCAAFSLPEVERTSTLLSTTMPGTYQWYYEGQPIQGASGNSHVAQENGQYTVEVVNGFGCLMLSPAVAVNSVSIEEHERQSMRIIPNPAHDQVRLVLMSALHGVFVEVVDTQGRVVRELRMNSGSDFVVPLGGITPGLYIVRVSANGTGQTVAPLMIQ